MTKIIKANTYEVTGEVRDLKAYKFAKIVTNDLSKAIPRVEASLIYLKPYKRYSQIADIINVLETKLGILNAQYTKYNNILKNKGKI